MKRKNWINSRAMFSAAGILTVLLILTNPVFSADDSCIHCGMKKAKFGHSWVIIEHDDGTIEGVCSIHCAAIDMALHTDKLVKNITVGDYNTKKQIDAQSAYWVIGGDKMGVMTARAKWAFETKEAADKFMKAHGGRPAIYKEVIKAAFEDMHEDTLMIQQKKQMMKKKK